jgi:hypothetical protein
LPRVDGAVEDALGQRHPRAGIKQSDPPPIYTVHAGDVVPGMGYEDQIVVRVWRERDDPPDMVRGQLGPGRLGGFKFRAAHAMVVSLPGPSPRKLCCTCPKDEGLLRRGPRLWYPPADAPLDAHVAGCPVAPRPGLHCGMRLWPAPWKGCAWGIATTKVDGQDHFDGWVSESLGRIEPHNLTAPETLMPAERDPVLMCFYHPPSATFEPRPRDPWDRRWTGDTPWETDN